MRDDIEQKAIDTIRLLAVDMVEQANSGHPGMPLGAAAMAYTLWVKHLRHNPRNPGWPDRDRFVLSAGHGSALLYALLHLGGYNLSLDDLKRFRQWGSKTPGHPEYGLVPGCEATTGPLGQGFANGVGMALAERYLADSFNRGGHTVVDHHTYAIVSDGDLMEGISSEAGSVAGAFKLGKLIYLYDDNKISIEGKTDLTFTEDVQQRFEALGWHVQKVDGYDTAAISRAIEQAQAEQEKPSLLCCRTNIGYGSPKQDSESCHGAPIGKDGAAETRRKAGWPEDAVFHVPDDVRRHFGQIAVNGSDAEGEWQARLDSLRNDNAELAAEFERQVVRNELPEGWDADLPRFPIDGGAIATRKASGAALNRLALRVPALVGGSADLAGSNKTWLDDFGDLGAGEAGGRNLHFGVREIAMGGMANGMMLHGGLRPYVGTFLVFSDYVRPTMRVAALSGLPVIYVYTHDSIAVGEDGPTHQPVEQLMSLRAMPGLTVIRPSDANETAEAWRQALLRTGGPTALCLTRQGLPVLDRTELAPASELARGGYVLRDAEDAKLLLLATGSEVHLALEAAEKLAGDGIGARVVAMPSVELFREQDRAYRDQVLPPALDRRLAIEMGASMGWWEWVGSRGEVLGLDRFGASAPAQDVMQNLGFTVEEVLKRCKVLLG